MRRGLDTFANDGRDATSALARLVPELLRDRLREFDRDTFHARHEYQGNLGLTDQQYVRNHDSRASQVSS